MKTLPVRRAALSLAVLLLAGCSESSTGPGADLNLGFEELDAQGQPVGWTRVGAPGFDVVASQEMVHGGRNSLLIAYEGSGELGTARRDIPLADARGKNVRISGWIRTANVAPTVANTGWAAFWVRAGGPAGSTAAFDNMGNTGPSGTTGWQRFEVQVDVPQNATSVQLGMFLAGSGRAWFDDLEITIDGRRYN